jgi:hypothetical protein
MSNHAELRSPKIFFLTFGAGEKNMLDAADRLGDQALESGFFDEVEVLSNSDLPSNVTGLFTPNRFEEIRGFGFWAWKPFLINEKIQTLMDGDVLIYLDAGSEINKRGGARFTYYLDFVARNDVLVFPTFHQHRFWVKPHYALRIETRDYYRNQVWAGLIMLRVSEISRRIVSRWYELAFQDSGSALTEEVDEGEHYQKGFREHRFDQSILSHVIFSENVPVLDRDETHHSPWVKGEEFPFLSLRNKTGVSKLDKIFRKSKRREFMTLVRSRLSVLYLFRLIFKKDQRTKQNN